MAAILPPARGGRRDLRRTRDSETCGLPHNARTDLGTPVYAGARAFLLRRAAEAFLCARCAMDAEGFAVCPPEWWHNDYRDRQSYPVLDVPFADVAPPRSVQ